MKFTTFYKQVFIYIFFLFTLTFGLYLNEDLAGGATFDYQYHIKVVEILFDESIVYGLLNYEGVGTHSPLFIIFLKYLTQNSEIIGRFFYLLLSSSIVVIFYKILELKFETKSTLLFLLSNFFFLSPYFRSYSIWPGDETLALILFCFSVYFFLKFSKKDSSKLNIIYNVIFIALASYIRPIYCLFSIFYFYVFFIEKKCDIKFFIYYSLLNIVLAFPAFYYVFILKIDFFSSAIKEFNFINTFVLFYLTIFFYLTPFILLNLKEIFLIKINFFNIFITIVAFLLVFIFFNYTTSSGGGFYFHLSKLIFNNNFLVYLVFPFAFYISNQVLQIQKLRNFIILIIIIFFEIDGHFYMETYDPLFYILCFTIFKISIINKIFIDLNKSISIIFLFQIFLIFSKLFQQNFL